MDTAYPTPSDRWCEIKQRTDMRINRQRVRPAHDAKINVFLLPFLVISRAFAKRGENATGDSFSKSHAMCPYIPFTCSLIEPVRDCKLYLAVNDTA